MKSIYGRPQGTLEGDGIKKIMISWHGIWVTLSVVLLGSGAGRGWKRLLKERNALVHVRIGTV